MMALNRILSMVFVCCIAFGMTGTSTRAESASLTAEQQNAIAMLNYMTVLTQETNAAKNSRMFMEQAYASLVNNTYPNAVDSRTLSQMTGLLDTMEKYRMVNVKRDRLQYIYEQCRSVKHRLQKGVRESSQGKGGDLRSKYNPSLIAVRQKENRVWLTGAKSRSALTTLCHDIAQASDWATSCPGMS